jgi:ECF sigma factor
MPAIVALGISGETVMRDWRVAREWLMREMKAQGHSTGQSTAPPEN